MTDVETPDVTGTAGPYDLVIEIDHSAYYRWLPIADGDITWSEDGNATRTSDGSPLTVIDATWPGFKMYRSIINEPTTSTTRVDRASLAQINDDREAAGLARRDEAANLIRHLEDGPWPKHFPMESITAVRCDQDPAVAARLSSYFVPGGAA